MNSGGRVLVIEEEAFIAMEIEIVLEDLGYQAVVATVMQEAVGHVSDARFDGVILDLTLHGTATHDIIDGLLLRRVPVVLCTGYPKADIPPRFRDLTMIEKPFDLERLASLVSRTFQIPPSAVLGPEVADQFRRFA
jgi:DNA-binding NtrC family response regulator